MTTRVTFDLEVDSDTEKAIIDYYGGVRNLSESFSREQATQGLLQIFLESHALSDLDTMVHAWMERQKPRRTDDPVQADKY